MYPADLGPGLLRSVADDFCIHNGSEGVTADNEVTDAFSEFIELSPYILEEGVTGTYTNDNDFSWYIWDRNISMVNPYWGEWVTTLLRLNPRRSYPHESSPYLSVFIVI